MEESPKKFEREVSKIKSSFFGENWEDIIKDEVSARGDFEILEAVLKGQGINLKNIKVLEVGSGNSVFLDYLRKKGVSAFGVDARPRGNKESPQVLARIEQLPFLAESFDAIFSSAVFDSTVYKQDQDLMLQEIERVLKHGGIYVNADTKTRLLPPEGLSLIKDNSIFQLKTVYKKS